MHVTLVEINVHEDKIDEFIEVFRQNHLGSVQEEGNLRFDVLQDPEVNSRFYIYEAYKDEDAVAFHKTTPHYKTCVCNGCPTTTNCFLIWFLYLIRRACWQYRCQITGWSRPMCSCAKLPGNKTTRIAGVSRWLAFMLTTIF